MGSLRFRRDEPTVIGTPDMRDGADGMPVPRRSLIRYSLAPAEERAGDSAGLSPGVQDSRPYRLTNRNAFQRWSGARMAPTTAPTPAPMRPAPMLSPAEAWPMV